ncbi:hypothetical protein K7432_015798 [Basidiobolus ranarum]|uniref:Uncharacterized protein n=1 Tax=Basidiobolus ranarum TaxID=34480 RepID=A0ABR2VMJ3_9FUNG
MNLEVNTKKAKLAQLEHELQEVNILNGELSSLKPKSRVYEKWTSTSTLFFLADKRANVTSNKKKQEIQLANEIKRLKEDITKLEKN